MALALTRTPQTQAQSARASMSARLIGQPLQPLLGHSRRVVQPVRRSNALICAAAADAFVRDRSSAPRFVQHKNEAKAFYRWLSIVYDYIVNPGHWTVDMRTDALEPAMLKDPNLKVARSAVWCYSGVCSRLHDDDKSSLIVCRSWMLEEARASARRGSCRQSRHTTSR